ncbi:MAG: hypothetical protein WC602_00645 [archaeon]
MVLIRAIPIALIALLFASGAMAFAMNAEPSRTSAGLEKIDFTFTFKSLSSGNYSARIAVPECALDSNAECGSANYYEITLVSATGGNCLYEAETKIIECNGSADSNEAIVKFTALNSSASQAAKQRASEKWNARMTNAGKTEEFSQTVFLDWTGVKTGDTNNADANASAGKDKNGADTKAKPESGQQKAWNISGKQVFYLIIAILVVCLIAFGLAEVRSPHRKKAERRRKRNRRQKRNAKAK